MNNNAHLLMHPPKKKQKQKTNQNKLKANRMSMRLLGGIWSVIRLSLLKPKNGRLKFTLENISLPVLLVLNFWDIPYKIFLLGQNGFLLRARAWVKMEEKCRFWYGASAHEVPSGMDW